MAQLDVCNVGAVGQVVICDCLVRSCKSLNFL